jgi:NAD(P)H-dependent FMN reductase
VQPIRLRITEITRLKLVAIIGSAVHSGKTRTAAEMAVSGAIASDPNTTVDIVDLAQHRVSVLDGRPPEAYEDDTVNVIARVGSGTVFLIATPIYRGTYTGALKNLIDHLPLETFENKAVGLLATGATVHHYLAIDYQFRGLMAWFNAYVLPGCVYLDSAAFSGGELANEVSIAQLKQLGNSLVTLANRLDGVQATPPCLTRQMMGARRDRSHTITR